MAINNEEKKNKLCQFTKIQNKTLPQVNTCADPRLTHIFLAVSQHNVLRYQFSCPRTNGGEPLMSDFTSVCACWFL